MTLPSGPVAIETRGLTKKFGSLAALDGVDLSIASGESVALFGPNGAGKTTLVRILTLALRSTGGSFDIAGHESRKGSLEIRRRIGVIGHRTLLYDDLTAMENLEFFGRLYGIESPQDRAMELLRTVDLHHRADDAIHTFSRGMQQRVSLARALVHDPPIVFLDEPFTGLDPFAAETLRATLEALRRDRRTLLMVTHHLGQGLDLSDRWIIMARGKIVDQGSSSETDRNRFEPDYFRRLGDATRPGRSQ